MQIEKKQNHSTSSSFAATSSGTKVAQEYAAIFPTRLALARWTRGGDIPHVHCFEHELPMRAAWYEQAQRRFQAWLESGGFQQPEPGCLGSAIADTPQQDETKTELSRKVVVHAGPRSASRSVGTLDASGPVCEDGGEARHSPPSPFPGMQSFSEDAGGDGPRT